MTMRETNGTPLRPGERAVVVGAGKSGLSAARLLQVLGARVRLVEREADKVPQAFRDRAESEGVEILCGEHTPAHFADATLVVPCPGVPNSAFVPLLPQDRTPPIWAETELAWRCLQGESVLAVTGTSGKTTTTGLCAAMLEAAGLTVFTGGNIGVPLSEYVLGRRRGAPKVDVVVLELSSFQLQHCLTLRPRVGVLLNISANHLDHHTDMQDYTDAKMRLFRLMEPSDAAVFGSVPVSLARDYGIRARVTTAGSGDAFTGLQLIGAHNRANAEAARLACREWGVTQETALAAARAFRPVEHRLERVDEKHGVLYVNDSKATTVEALRVALNAFDRPVLLLAGGKFKGGDLQGLRELLTRKVKAVALYGAGRTYFEDAWQGVVPLSWDETLERAVRRLVTSASSGDVVLLAPATASFDQYTDYLARGEDFKRIVRELPS